MSFDKTKCVVRTFYCGNSRNLPPDTSSTKYSRHGTPHECMKRGYGMGSWTEVSKQLPPNSVRHIRYIGPVYEENFRRYGMSSLNRVVTKFSGLTAQEKNILLRKCCRKRNNIVDLKAYNFVLLFLHSKGVKNLPSCKVVVE